MRYDIGIEFYMHDKLSRGFNGNFILEQLINIDYFNESCFSHESFCIIINIYTLEVSLSLSFSNDMYMQYFCDKTKKLGVIFPFRSEVDF